MTEQDILAALEKVQDPEYPLSIVDMGLVYGVRVSDSVAEVDLSFTSTGCPCITWILEDVRTELLSVPGLRALNINIVWDPPWTIERLTERGKRILETMGVAVL